MSQLINLSTLFIFLWLHNHDSDCCEIQLCCPLCASVYIMCQLWPACATVATVCVCSSHLCTVWVYIQYMCLHVRVLFFSHTCDLFSLNHNMLQAAKEDDDSVMWKCHQSLGTVTGFCLSASDTQTEAISVHFTITAVSFFLFFSSNV